MDIKTEFLYGSMKEEIYLDLLQSSQLDGMVVILKRCIDGLKQSLRELYYQLIEYLGPFGFVITTWDSFILVHESGNLFLAIYVDDIILFEPTGKRKD
jgi:hypothetical protein